MGFLQRLLSALGLVKKPAKIVVVGLDNSGKTTLINHLKPKRSAALEVTPTVGLSEERFERGALNFTVWDMSGAGSYRSLWEAYYAEADAVIYVVDAADKIRLCVARDELDALLGHEAIKRRRPALLVFANKMDIPGALEASEVSVVMGLPALTDRAWQIQASNALSGEGVDEGVAWLVQQLLKPSASAAAALPSSVPAAASAGAAAGGGGGGGAGRS